MQQSQAAPSSRFFDDYEALNRHFDGLGFFHMDLTLDRIRRVLEAMELVRPSFTTFQAVGTNGKGSTAVFLSSLCREAGMATGVFLSPYFVSRRESVRVDGVILPEERWVRAANRVMAAGGEDLTQFELLTAVAMVLFDESDCAAAVLEAGLGGRYDATTAVHSDCTVFTPIGMDHVDVLGPTLTHIALDKAGAMRPGGLAVVGDQQESALLTLQEEAHRLGVAVVSSREFVVPEAVELRLHGPHQRDNARLATAAFCALADRNGWPQSPEVLRRGLERAWFPGRLQRVQGHDALPDLILDGAHNEPGVRALADALTDMGVRPGGVVFACMQDKRMANAADCILELTDGPVFLPPIVVAGARPVRAADPEKLADLFGDRARVESSLADALAHAEKGPVLVCGSLYLLAEFYRLHPEFLESESESTS